MEGSDVHLLTWEEAKQRDSMITDVSYHLKIGLSKEASYAGEYTVQFSSSSQGSTWIEFKGKQINKAILNDLEIDLDWKQWKLSLPEIREGPNTLSISFINNYVNDGLGLHKTIDPEDGEAYLYTQFEPFAANKMFPCFDQPDIKATMSLIVAAPSDWRVIANENATSSIPLEDPSFPMPSPPSQDYILHTFPETPKLSTYLFALCAGPYVEFRHDDNEVNIPLGLYSRKALASYVIPERYFHWTVEGLKFYQSFFGYPYPFRKYDQVFVPEFNMGAMENVGCVTYRDQYVFKDGASYIQLIRVCNTFLHEMTHMWFGNLVTMKWWNDLWLNESFATFMSYLCVSLQLPSEYPDVWSEFLTRKGWGYATDQLSTTHPISTPVKDTDECESNFDGISYSKGSAVLKQLYFLVGHEVFKGAITKYMNDFAFKNAEFDDLIRYLDNEAQAQNKTLNVKEWANSWVLTAGLNELEPIVEVDPSGMISSFSIKQSPALPEHPTLRYHKIIVEAFAHDGTSIKKETVEVLPQEVTSIASFQGVNAAAILLNSGDWGYCKIRIDERSLQFFKTNLGQLQDDLAKRLIWRALYDMVRDIKLSGAEFIEFAIEQVPMESNCNIANYALEISHVILFGYIDRGPNREDYASFLFSIILEKIQNAPSQQDLVVYQKRLFFYLYKLSDVERCVGWIRDNSTGIENFTLAKSDVWSIIKKFSEFSVDASELVEAQLKVDSSDTAQLSKLYCEAAYPTSQTKANTWDKYMNAIESMSRYERESSMAGFNRPRQGELLQGYFDQYFAKTIEFLNTKDKEIGKDFCENLLPAYENDEVVIQKVSKLIEDVPKDRFELIRTLKEKVDMMTKRSRGKELSRNYIASKSN